MAGLNIEIVVRAQDKASKPLFDIKGAFGDLEKIGKGAMLGIGAGLVAVGTAALGVGTASFLTAKDFQEATKSIIIGTGASGDALADMEGIVKSLRGTSAGLNVDFGTMGSVVGELNTRLDVSGDMLEGISSQVLNFARVHKLDATPAAQMTGKLINALGMEASDSALLLDKLTLAGQMSGISVDRLGQFILDAGPSFDELGFDLDRSIALFASFEKAGARPEEVIGSMSRAMRSMIEMGAEDPAEAFAQLIKNIEEAPNALDAAALGFEYFGRAGDKVAEDIRAGRFEVEEWTNVIANAGGELDDVSQRSLTFTDKLGIMKDRALISIMPIGEAFLNIADKVMPHFESAFAWMETNVIPIIEQVSEFVTIFLGDILEGVPILEALEGALDQVFGAETAAKVMGIVDNVIEFIGSVKDTLGPIFEAVAGFFSWKDILLALGIAIGVVIVTAVLPFIKVALGLIATFALVTATIAILRNAWESDWGGIRTFLTNVWEGTLKPIFNQFREWLSVNIPVAIATVRNIIDTFLNWLSSFWSSHGEGILGTAQRIWDGILGVLDFFVGQFKLIFEAFSAAFSGDWTTFGEKLREVWDNAWEVIKEIFGKVGAWFADMIPQLIEMIVSFFTDTDWLGVGKSIIEGIAGGITGAVGFIADAAKNAARSALDAAKGFLGIKSPSSLFAEIGQQMMQGMEVGIRSNAMAPANAMVGATNYVTKSATYHKTLNIYTNAPGEIMIRDWETERSWSRS